MAAHLPTQGRILDLGCGHGLLALRAILQNPSRQVLGLDHDQERIRVAKAATVDLSNLNFKVGTFPGLTSATPQDPEVIQALAQGFHGIAIIDAMHYFNYPAQAQILKAAFDHLKPGGILLIREVEPHSGIISSWNRLYEKIATGIGFTQSQNSQLYFRSKLEWCGFIHTFGFKVTWKKCSSVLFADILFICEKVSS
jgi:2-polyprenyl-3-methyl-5-hydroxy-6-metoxy-1,4-benzoquinol methylase